MAVDVMNIVTISGSVETIEKVKKQIINVDNNNGEVLPFSFESIISCPKDLIEAPDAHKVEVGMTYINGNESKKKEIESHYADVREMDEIIRLGQIGLDYIKKYGYIDAYYWCIGEWGTKWDAYNVSVSTSEDTIELEFETAWDAPIQAFKKLAEQYPHITIDIHYASANLGQNCGSYHYENGEWLFSGEKDYKFACVVWDYEPDTDENKEKV